MARKKKVEAPDRSWHKKVMAIFLAQVDEGDRNTGFTFSEAREKMGLEPDAEGYGEVAVAMVELRNEGFLGHKFSSPSLKEDFFLGDPVDIPNIQKRLNGNIRQLVFFAAPMAMAIGDEGMEAAVEAGGTDNKWEPPASVKCFTRDTIFSWFDSLGEVLDIHVSDAEFMAESIKMVAALTPEK